MIKLHKTYIHYKNNKPYTTLNFCKVQENDIWTGSIFYKPNDCDELFIRTCKEFELKFILKEDDKEFKEDNDNFIATITEYLKEISKNKHNFLWSLDENHSDLSKTHPMSDFSHSWWFHCLYDHCHISWEDMLRNGDFWSDVKVTYQYFDKKQK